MTIMIGSKAGAQPVSMDIIMGKNKILDSGSAPEGVTSNRKEFDEKRPV